MKAGPLLLSLALSAACTTYEYEEEVHLEVDGSGRIRMSGSREIVRRLHGAENAGLGSVEGLLRGEGVEILSVLEARREGRPFVHLEARFRSWNDLCERPLFRDRRCRLEVGPESLQLTAALPRARGDGGGAIDPASQLAVRFHFPSRVRYHNSPHGIERGNILSWKRGWGEHFRGTPLEIEVRFERRSVLAAAVRILALAGGLVALVILAALAAMIRKGRRQLAAEARVSSLPRPGRP